MEEGLYQGLIPSHSQIVLYSRGVYITGVAEDQPLLLFVKGDVLLCRDRLLRLGVLVEEVLYHLTLFYGLGDDLRYALRGHPLVKYPQGLYDRYRSPLAKAMTAGGLELYDRLRP